MRPPLFAAEYTTLDDTYLGKLIASMRPPLFAAEYVTRAQGNPRALESFNEAAAVRGGIPNDWIGKKIVIYASMRPPLFAAEYSIPAKVLKYRRFKDLLRALADTFA